MRVGCWRRLGSPDPRAQVSYYATTNTAGDSSRFLDSDGQVNARIPMRVASQKSGPSYGATNLIKRNKATYRNTQPSG